MISSQLPVAVLFISVVVALSACDRLPIGSTSTANHANTKLNLKLPQIVDANLPAPTTIIECGDLISKQTLTIKGHSALSQGCDLTGKSIRFILDSSHSSLNCQGATFSTRADDESNASAITIQPKTDTAIEDIALANCHVDGYGHALHIRQYSNPNQRYARGLTDPAANRALAPQDIRVINVSSLNSKNSGIFVGDHVSQVTFEQMHVQNAGTVGLYLEFGSRNNVIKDSVFVGNGFRSFKPNREAIAVDSSSNNRIENNTFIHNGAGSILLYRNCFEHANDPARSNHFKRTESSRDNIISDNLFQDEPVGVWVASRQSRDLKGFECGAYEIKETLFARYHLDSAKDNTITNNRFEQVEQGIIVEDDGTLIEGNTFDATVAQPITIGSDIREASTAGAVKDTVIKDNVFIDKMLAQAIKITDASKKATEIR
ncbi:right-handed parallel beta-helix repeat-containing protein [uncultured Psychrobacter sp.]|uniref:right-handed parallel beta-helix repeat-containing protein n=1 Tax=uncultured Psychrobacter sp. TaxID=259303 RepID=UPI00345A9299